MKRLFGGKSSAPPPPTLDDASARLGTRGQAIDAKVKSLDDELLKLRDQIQKTRGPMQERYKQKALNILKQKKQYESQRDAVYQQQCNIDQMAFTKEMVADTHLQITAMKDVAKQLKTDLKKFSVDDVENMHDDLVDLYQEQQEIQEIMGRAYGVPEDVDEDALNDELDALAFDMEKEKDASYLDTALATPSTRLPTTRLPTVPQGQTTTVAPETTDVHGLEAQLGL